MAQGQIVIQYFVLSSVARRSVCPRALQSYGDWWWDAEAQLMPGWCLTGVQSPTRQRLRYGDCV